MAINGTSLVLERDEKTLFGVLQLYQPQECFFKTWGKKAQLNGSSNSFNRDCLHCLGSPNDKRTEDTPSWAGGSAADKLEKKTAAAMPWVQNNPKVVVQNKLYRTTPSPSDQSARRATTNR